MNAWQRFRAKPADEQRSAVWAVALAPLVKISLRMRGYAATVRMLEKVARTPSPNKSEATARVAESAMDRLPFSMSCLDRSLVVWWLLGGSEAAVIRFGVAPGDEGEAPRFHAWVEADGVTFDFGTEHAVSFLPLQSPPAIQPDKFA